MSQMIAPMMMVGSIFQAVGSIQAGNAQKAAYNVQAAEHDRAARDIEVAGSSAVREEQYKQAQLGGRQVEGYAAGGVASGGSVLEVLSETNRRNAQNIADLSYNYATQAYGQRVAGVSSRFAGSQAQRAGVIQGVTALTAGVGQQAGLRSQGFSFGGF